MHIFIKFHPVFGQSQYKCVS